MKKDMSPVLGAVILYLLAFLVLVLVVGVVGLIGHGLLTWISAQL